MKVLVLGGGGREHALSWKLAQSPLCEQVFIAPGNAGTSQVGTNLPVNPLDFQAVKAAVIQNEIDLVLVGPEEPLVKGIVDFFEADEVLNQIPCIGPSAAGAQLEGSKAFAKAFMADMLIPTAAYREFGAEDLEAAVEYVLAQPLPIVLKADGLAAGKGVIIAESHEEAVTELQAMLGGKFGAASARVVIEQFLKGIEFSVFVLTDGEHYQLLPVAKDYKRIGEGDTGLNTGGMGAVSPVAFADAAMMEKVRQRIVEPTVRGLQEKQLPYRGFIFLGLIDVEGDPYVIEYNCRMGDPETEVVIPRLKSDLLLHLIALLKGTLHEEVLEEEERAAATVMMVAGGYPGDYEKGKPISGIGEVKESLVFHAGTRADGDAVLSNGGRVLAVTSYGANLSEAVQQSLRSVAGIHFDGAYYRRDIGKDLGA